jgi:Na+/melibiose symporter-like transporter
MLNILPDEGVYRLVNAVIYICMCVCVFVCVADECEELLLRRQVEAEEMKLQHLQGVIAKNKVLVFVCVCIVCVWER